MFLKLKKPIFIKKVQAVVVINFLLSSIYIEIFLLLSLRWWRELFPPSEIGNSKIVGYSQYFGYPFYFDSVYLMILIFVPIFILVTVVYLFNKWER